MTWHSAHSQFNPIRSLAQPLHSTLPLTLPQGGAACSYHGLHRPQTGEDMHGDQYGAGRGLQTPADGGQLWPSSLGGLAWR